MLAAIAQALALTHRARPQRLPRPTRRTEVTARAAEVAALGDHVLHEVGAQIPRNLLERRREIADACAPRRELLLDLLPVHLHREIDNACHDTLLIHSPSGATHVDSARRGDLSISRCFLLDIALDDRQDMRDLFTIALLLCVSQPCIIRDRLKQPMHGIIHRDDEAPIRVARAAREEIAHPARPTCVLFVGKCLDQLLLCHRHSSPYRCPLMRSRLRHTSCTAPRASVSWWPPCSRPWP